MQLARICSVVGLDLSVRAYPNGSPLRDKAQLALLARFRERLSAKLSVQSEVPLPISGDLRAWDLLILGAGQPIGVEAETRLADIQALERRIALKARDGQVSRVILVVSGSRGNRLAIRAAAQSLGDSFPVPGRLALAAHGDGRDPGGSPCAPGLIRPIFAWPVAHDRARHRPADVVHAQIATKPDPRKHNGPSVGHLIGHKSPSATALPSLARPAEVGCHRTCRVPD